MSRIPPDRGAAPPHRGRGGGGGRGRGRGRGDGEPSRGGRGRGNGRGGFRGGRGGPPGAPTGPPHHIGPATAAAATSAVTDGRTSIAGKCFHATISIRFLPLYTLIVAEGHVRSLIVKRPGYGTLAVRTLTVNVNAYEVTIPDEIIRHYDGMPSILVNLKHANHIMYS